MCMMRKNFCNNLRENPLSGTVAGGSASRRCGGRSESAEISGDGYIILAALLVFAFAFLPLLLRQVA